MSVSVLGMSVLLIRNATEDRFSHDKLISDFLLHLHEIVGYNYCVYLKN